MAETTKGPKSENMKVDVKVGILHTIADAIYSTTAGKIREAVANARDNKATWIIIIIDQTKRSICIFDNGPGISKSRFQEIFESIGYGTMKDEAALSYFGLGLMSIFQLGKKVKIFTRFKGEKVVRVLNVDTQAIFNKDNEKLSISTLRKSIVLQDSNESARIRLTPPILNEALTKPSFNGHLESYTEFLIEDVPEEEISEICRAEFIEGLRRLLPLRVQDDEPFLQNITGKKNKAITKILNNPKFCPTIDVFFGIQEEDKIDQLWKYFPAFRSDLVYPDDNVIVGEENNFAYYVIHSVAIDLNRNRDLVDESGFWIRNQNFLVKSSDFLERPGPGKKKQTIDQPLKSWIFGEIFHTDMNSFITVSRNDFLFEKDDFRGFRDKFASIVNPLNVELREIHKKRRVIIDDLIEPFSKFAEPHLGVIKKTEDRLRDLVHKKVLDGPEFNNQMLLKLEKARDKKIENKNLCIDFILKRGKSPITLGEDENAIVKIDPMLSGKTTDHQITWDAAKKKVIVSISPELFKSRETVFLGKSFKIYFVLSDKNNLGFSVDVNNGEIFINPFNEDLMQYSVSIFDVYVALHIAKTISSGMDELIKNALSLLGASSRITAEYIMPLGDDLRRTLKLARSGN